jgi:centromeric protein E
MERIHVTVRARPLSPEDAKTTLWRISDNSIFIPNHTSKFEFGTPISLIFISISISISYILFNFKLCSADQIFNENCKTSEVYEARTKDIVAAAVRGFNGLQDIFYLLFCLFFGCCFGL